MSVAELKKLVEISIHTLRVEGDEALLINPDTGKISIHTLRVEGDLKVSQQT